MMNVSDDGDGVFRDLLALDFSWNGIEVDFGGCLEQIFNNF